MNFYTDFIRLVKYFLIIFTAICILHYFIAHSLFIIIISVTRLQSTIDNNITDCYYHFILSSSLDDRICKVSPHTASAIYVIHS